jgi:NDP-sugar pyrophosphorylase family protein
MKLVIPMAGDGTRFSKYGYTLPKPLIDACGKPIISHVINNFNSMSISEVVFICRQEHEDKHGISSKMEQLCGNRKSSFVFVNELTEGAACSLLLAKKHINIDEPIIIANSDQYVAWDINAFISSCQNLDGCILTFRSEDPKWSYVKLGNNGLVECVAEKVAISDMATVGIYHWTRGCNFVSCAEQMIKKNIRTRNEFYLCPVYNEAVELNLSIGIHEIDRQDMWGLGTPEDLEIFKSRFCGL